MEDEKDEGRGFRVTDRRRFSETGESRPDAADEQPPAASPSESTSGAFVHRPAPEQPVEPEPVNFSTFVLGLSTQALLHLGDIPNPVTQGVEQDLDAAKHLIDILGILKEKTRNNLEPAEESLLESILYDLRMRYVELVRRT